MSGYRPKGIGGPMYNPERDIAYITPTLMMKAMELLDEANWSAETIAYLDEHEITAEELGRAVEAYAESQLAFVGNATVQSLRDAFRAGGFDKIRDETKQLLYSTVGEVLTAAWFMAVRDVTMINEDTPVHRDMHEFVAMAHTVASRCTPLQPVPTPQRDVDIAATLASLKNAQARIGDLEREVVAHVHKTRELEGLLAAAGKSHSAAMQETSRVWESFRKMSLCQHILYWWKNRGPVPS